MVSGKWNVFFLSFYLKDKYWSIISLKEIVRPPLAFYDIKISYVENSTNPPI